MSGLINRLLRRGTGHQTPATESEYPIQVQEKPDETVSHIEPDSQGDVGYSERPTEQSDLGVGTGMTVANPNLAQPGEGVNYTGEESERSATMWVHPMLAQKPQMYSDSALEQLTSDYEVQDTLSTMLFNLLRREIFNPRFGNGIFGSSPFRNSEFEGFLGDYLTTSAVENKWVGVDLEYENFSRQGIESIMESGGTAKSGLNGRDYGLSNAVEEGYFKIVSDNGKYFGLPTQKFLDYLKDTVVKKLNTRTELNS